MPRATPVESDSSAPGFSFPAIGRKKITAAFDGGRLTSDGGVLLLAQAERAMGIAARVIESASRIRVAFASACADAGVFTAIAPICGQRPHSQRGSAAETPSPDPSTSKAHWFCRGENRRWRRSPGSRGYRQIEPRSAKAAAS